MERGEEEKEKKNGKQYFYNEHTIYFIYNITYPSLLVLISLYSMKII